MTAMHALTTAEVDATLDEMHALMDAAARNLAENDLAAAAAEAGVRMHDARIARNNRRTPSIDASHPSVRAIDAGATWADDGAIVR